MAERSAKTNTWMVTTMTTSNRYTPVATGTAMIASAKFEDEDQADHDEDQHVARQHVGEERTDSEISRMNWEMISKRDDEGGEAFSARPAAPRLFRYFATPL